MCSDLRYIDFIVYYVLCVRRENATRERSTYARRAPAVRGSSCGFDAIRQGRRGRCLRSEVPRSSRRDKTSEDQRSAERSRGGTRPGVAAFEDEPVHRRYAMVSVSLRTAGSTYVCSASCVAAASSPSGRILPPAFTRRHRAQHADTHGFGTHTHGIAQCQPDRTPVSSTHMSDKTCEEVKPSASAVNRYRVAASIAVNVRETRY